MIGQGQFELVGRMARWTPAGTYLFLAEEVADVAICLLNLCNAADSFFELCFKPRSCDGLGFDPRKAILLKFTIHFALSLFEIFAEVRSNFRRVT